MIHVLTGSNSFGLRAELHRLVDAFIADQGDMADMALERLDGEETGFERIQEALQSLPFLASKKMVLLRSPSANKQFVEKAADLLAELPDTTELLIVEPKLDKRLAYYKLLKKQKQFQEFSELDESGLTRWLVTGAQQKGAKLSAADARYLVERVGASQQVLSTELEKLSLYDPNITRRSIDELTVASPQSTIFQLLEAAFAGNTHRAMALYAEQRQLKVEPQQIIAMLTWQLHVLVLIKAAGSRSPETIAAESKISPYVIRKSVAIVRSLAYTRLKQLVSDLLEIDSLLKRKALDADDVLMDYLLRLA